jgi:heat shock protein HtpX
MNGFKTAILFIVLTVLFISVGYLVGGQGGASFAFFLALIMNFGAYWFSDKIVLATYRAKQVTEQEHPRLYRIVRQTAQAAGLPMPKVYVVPNPTPNAFATGRNPQHAAVAATQGILDLLDDDELEAVMAHELGHVKNRDILVSTIAATIAGAISYIAYMAHWMPFMDGGDDDDRGGNIFVLLLVAILAPIAAMLIQMAISRQREYGADRSGSQISHKPRSLASALAKLHDMNRRIPMQTNPATAHMFIVSPLSGKSFATLFSTHPPVEDRIAKLEEYARSGF